MDYLRDHGYVNEGLKGKWSGDYTLFTINNLGQASLTIQGWQYYEELRKGLSESKIAFMAMPFDDSQLDDLYLKMKKAVEQTGFSLERLDEGQPAGLIDDHLRVKIHRSKFMIADITGGNKNVFWEAGYADGLGKAVIYTCKKGEKPPFDTNHQLTVFWEEQNLDQALEKLKDTIRYTFPNEAKLND